MSDKKIYLDNAATTPLDPKVKEAMLPYLDGLFGNPSSTHSFGRKTKSAVETARRNIAKHLNALPSEICFTSGGTEADNIAIRASVNDLGVKRIITSAIEHSAVIKTSENMAKIHGTEIVMVDLLPDGSVDLEALENLLKEDKKTLVSLMHGNNEIANLLPLQNVGEMCRKYGAYFHSDTVQTMGHYRFDLSTLPIDFIACAGHKFHGPKGIGFLYTSRNLKINALISGGGQERGVRGGTENIYGIVGLSAAFDEAYADLEGHQSYVSDMKQYMISRLKSEISGITFNGQSESEDSLYTVLNVNLPPSANSGMMLFLLDLEGIACSGGSACSSGATKGSHVLEAIGANTGDGASLRFSFSRFTLKEDIDYTVERLCELLVGQETSAV